MGSQLKAMVVIDYPRKEYIKNSKNVFYNTNHGKQVERLMTGKRVGLGLNKSEYATVYFNSTIPTINSYTKTYNAISKTNIKKDVSKMNELIVKYKPKTVIMFGAQAYNNLIGKGALSNGIQKVEYKNSNGDTYTAPSVAYPSLNKPRFYSINEHDNILINTRLLKRYLSGDTELKPKLGKYKLITDFNEVQNIFENEIPQYDIVAVDFETNTLKTWLDGAKALCISLSWREHQGVTIPIEYPGLEPFNDKQQKQLIKYIIDLIQSSHKKVFHNAKFDIRMLMDLYGLKHATNVYDTLMMYYVGYNELPAAPKGLKHLACMYTDMNNYEDERDTFFENYLKQDKENWIKKEQERLDKEAEQTGKKPKKVKVSEYKPPTNKVDGSNLDFSWLPLETIYQYAAADTDVTLQLYHIFKKKIDKDKKFQNLIYEYYPRLTDALCWMEHTGIYLDEKTGKNYQVAYKNIQENLVKKIKDTVPEINEFEQSRLKNLEKRTLLMQTVKPSDRTEEQKEFIKEIGKYQGKDSKGIPKYKFNLRSKQHLQILFIDMLNYKLPLTKEFLTPAAMKAHKMNNPESITSKDYKMDKGVLNYLADTYNSKLAKLLIEYSKITKARDAFVDVLPNDVDSKHLIHPLFNISGTATGRLSSSNPKH